jgi:3-phosphoglycerate kinase
VPRGNQPRGVPWLKIPKSKIGHISLSGGALLNYIAGEKLPGIEVLK